MRNQNQRSNARTRDSAANVADAVRAGEAGRFEKEQIELARRFDRLRAAVDARMASAGADQSPIARQAAERLDALRTDQAARLREHQARETAALDRERSVSPSPDNTTGMDAGITMNELRELEQGRSDLMAAMVDEATRLRDAILADIPRNQQQVDPGEHPQPALNQDSWADRRRDEENRSERAREAASRAAQGQDADRAFQREAADRTTVDGGSWRSAVIDAALSEQESHGRTGERQQQDIEDAGRVADLNKRLDAVEAANRRRTVADEEARREAERQRSTAEPDSRERASLDRKVEALDRSLEDRGARADLLASVKGLIENGRLEVAERFLDALRAADSGSRRTRSQDDRMREQQLVDQLRQIESSRDAAVSAHRYAVLDRTFGELPPIADLWKKATDAVAANAEATQLKGRDLYERALANFLRRLTNEQDETARAARALFEEDGLRFARDKEGKLKAAMPMLDDPYVQSRTRSADVLRLSGQHLTRIEDGGNPVDPKNLAFQFARDNIHMDARTGPLSDYARERTAERIRRGDNEE